MRPTHLMIFVVLTTAACDARPGQGVAAMRSSRGDSAAQRPDSVVANAAPVSAPADSVRLTLDSVPAAVMAALHKAQPGFAVWPASAYPDSVRRAYVGSSNESVSVIRANLHGAGVVDWVFAGQEDGEPAIYGALRNDDGSWRIEPVSQGVGPDDTAHGVPVAVLGRGVGRNPEHPWDEITATHVYRPSRIDNYLWTGSQFLLDEPD